MSTLGNDLGTADIQTLIVWLKALADPSRLRIFRLLMNGVQCNCELGDALEMSPNLISHHLRVLREAGLVDAERDPNDGRWIYYAINREQLEDLNRMFGSVFNPSHIKERHPSCGPMGSIIPFAEMMTFRA